MTKRRKSGRGNSINRRRPSIFRNRSNPGSRWVRFYDIYLNVYERIYGFWNGVPRGQKLFWRNGKIVGHTSRYL